MIEQEFLEIDTTTNTVINVVVWDGDTNKWKPPETSIFLVKEITTAMLWRISSDKTNYTLQPFLNMGAVGFTYDGTVVTTNEPQPKPIVQPVSVGTQSA